LAFVVDDNSDLLLASSSQDTKIRLWKITPESATSSTALLSTLNDSTKATTLSSKGHVFKVGTTRYTVLLESVLAAHEEWVYSVCWQPSVLTAEGSCCFRITNTNRKNPSTYGLTIR
jgi:elongator complex protein 2